MRLTLREKEIFEVLKKEPLISQEEMAQRFGITRSSVAVHISNLMKKGVILGKGYVFNEQVSIVVIGEICVKIKIREHDSEQSIDVGYGGFAVDSARIFADFGINVKLITILGNDDTGTAVLHELQAKNVDTVNIYRHPEKRSCRRVCINDRAAFEENFSLAEYEKAVDDREWVVFNCEWLAVEPKFQEVLYRKSIGKDEEKLPYFCTFKNLEGIQEIPDYFTRYSLLVLGAGDSQALDSYIDKASDLVDRGTQNCVLTDGRSRLVYCNDKGTSEFPLLPNQSFDCNEGLAYLLVGLIYGLSSGYTMRQAVRIAIGTASANSNSK